MAAITRTDYKQRRERQAQGIQKVRPRAKSGSPGVRRSAQASVGAPEGRARHPCNGQARRLSDYDRDADTRWRLNCKLMLALPNLSVDTP
jgi:hypothetical protein